ncbi:MAG: cyclic nucleotide-binding domain-containing protein [Pseudomonadota bacterium]|jgi:CRP/FNR family cyclic AMP-dependent transcriptional regulator|nr:cyclic nucleotide-binding domain-containing protein [Alphaproteobacteria bacterium]
MSEIQNRHLYNTGEIIVEEGQPGSHICIIEKGLVEIWKNGPDGKKIVLGFLETGQIFGEMAIIDKSPRAATVTALEPTTIINIDGDKLLEALRQSPPILTTLLKTLITNIKKT